MLLVFDIPLIPKVIIIRIIIDKIVTISVLLILKIYI